MMSFCESNQMEIIASIAEWGRGSKQETEREKESFDVSFGVEYNKTMPLIFLAALPQTIITYTLYTIIFILHVWTLTQILHKKFY